MNRFIPLIIATALLVALKASAFPWASCTDGNTSTTISNTDRNVTYPGDVAADHYGNGLAATWSDYLSDALTLSGSGFGCWTGGIFDGPFDAAADAHVYYECQCQHVVGPSNCSDPESTTEQVPGNCVAYHTTAGVAPATEGGGAALEMMRILNYGDGVSIADDAGTEIPVVGSRFTYIHDDVVEDDWREHNVIFIDNYVQTGNMIFAFDTRSSASGRTEPEGRYWSMDQNLIHVVRFTNTYKQKPGHGSVFKVDGDGVNPDLYFTSNVILLGPEASSDGQQFPLVGDTVDCLNNVYLWDGTAAAYADMLAEGNGPDGYSNDGDRLTELNTEFPGCITVVLRGESETSAAFLNRDLDELDGNSWQDLVTNWNQGHFPTGGGGGGCGIGPELLGVIPLLGYFWRKRR